MQVMKQDLVKKKRGRPKGSKNKRKVLDAHVPSPKHEEIVEAVKNLKGNLNGLRYKLKSRIEKDALSADQCYYFIYDLKRGATYPEIIARFTVELEARLCTEFLNGTRKISKRMYNKKRICVL